MAGVREERNAGASGARTREEDKPNTHVKS
jgi:hypothetical protein